MKNKLCKKIIYTFITVSLTLININSTVAAEKKTTWICVPKLNPNAMPTSTEGIKQLLIQMGVFDSPVTISWGHTKGDAEWACNEWRPFCQANGCKAHRLENKDKPKIIRDNGCIIGAPGQFC